MLNLVVCIKQVPQVSQLPWDARRGTLRRDLAEGMPNPACCHALEAALQLKSVHGACITAVTMGPPLAEEVLRAALSVGADRGIRVSDPRLSGSDTLATARTLAAAIRTGCPGFDLILCGSCTSDSETAQVGPQLAEALDVPGTAYVEHLALCGRTLETTRVADEFRETLAFELPGVVTVSTCAHAPRYTPLGGVEDAFCDPEAVVVLDADALGLAADEIGAAGSGTRILKVYSPADEKHNVIFKGAARTTAAKLLDRYGDRIGAAAGKDLQEDGCQP